MAEIVYRGCASQLGLTRVESAGVKASWRSLPMDARARAALERRRYEVDKRWRSQKASAALLARFDRVLALDAEVLAGLRKLWPEAPPGRLQLLMDLVPGQQGQDVPDPYYGDEAGFERALDLIERSVRGFFR